MRECVNASVMDLVLNFFILVALSVDRFNWAEAQFRTDRICSTVRFKSQCDQLQRGNSPISCHQVQDSIDCALSLRNGTADFGVFSAESALLLAALQYDGLTVVKELRHSDRVDHKADFESVAVVRATHQNGIDGLKDATYCHPGFHYDRYEKWSERFLKHFERTVVNVDCDAANSTTTPAEIEVAALAQHFKAACRPGAWSNNLDEDAKLKAKYPNLCALCPSTDTCDYGSKNRHWEALRCLTNGGQVAYVSSQEAQAFFAPASEYSSLAADFAYLCSDGTLQLVNNQSDAPCSWLRQPWPLIISSDTRNIELSAKIMKWSQGSSTWETAFKEIITADSFLPHDTTIQKPRDYFREYREVPYSQTLCSTQSIWCTTSIEEKDKCEVIRVAGITSGIYPLIECRDPAPNTVTCLNDVSKGRADFMGIDSNYGFIARHPYNLVSAMYAETANEKYASVVVAIHANSTIDRFENLRNTKACFAEFGSISAMAFINTGKNRGFFPKKQCKYGKLLSEFFGPSCAPGALDLARNNEGQVDNLCALCRPSVSTQLHVLDAAQENADIEAATTQQPIVQTTTKELNCNADPSNGYYGNQGALNCLREDGDVAILEGQSLRQQAESLQIDPNDYRIICANGSLAGYTGFDVDDGCALTTIVDGEIVVSRQNPKTDGIINALASFDKYFQSDPDFKMFDAFAGKTDLLFKDSTLGLAARNEPNLGQSIENYKTLFQNLDDCVNMGVTSSASIISIMVVTLVSLLLTRL